VQPHEEHEDADPDGGQHLERRADVGREQFTGDRAVEQGRTEQDATDDLADHLRLPEPPAQEPEQPGHHNDHENSGHERRERTDVHAFVSRFALCLRRTLGRATRGIAVT
jgi:hypothetical protein